MKSKGLLLKPIAYIETDFNEKFGIPRQSGRAKSLQGKIVFCPEYRNPDALREIEGFSHLWLIFDFSKAHREKWSPTVRPPRLGGNKKIGVFASRSPFRPNPLGLSVVKLEKAEKTKEQGTVLIVSGVDLLNHTPIYDIKPYLPFADCIAEAVGGYADEFTTHKLTVDFDESLIEPIPKEKRKAVLECLADDPRPSYQNDDRTYIMKFGNYDFSFFVKDSILKVTKVEEL